MYHLPNRTIRTPRTLYWILVQSISQLIEPCSFLWSYCNVLTPTINALTKQTLPCPILIQTTGLRLQLKRNKISSAIKFIEGIQNRLKLIYNKHPQVHYSYQKIFQVQWWLVITHGRNPKTTPMGSNIWNVQLLLFHHEWAFTTAATNCAWIRGYLQIKTHNSMTDDGK